tara:strand:- start:140579 stop:141142 length:564 start_codon:yes stop_codon:yes gene_type:complete
LISKVLLDRKVKRFLKKHNSNEIMIVKCIIETFFISAGVEFDIFYLDGNAVIPYFEKDKITKKEYHSIIEHELPVLLYNKVLVESFPVITELDEAVNELEENLIMLKDKDNLWVKCILKHYYNRSSFDMNMFLELDDKTATAYGAARAHYNSYCVSALDKVKKVLMEKNNKTKVMDWLNFNKIKGEE